MTTAHAKMKFGGGNLRRMTYQSSSLLIIKQALYMKYFQLRKVALLSYGLKLSKLVKSKAVRKQQCYATRAFLKDINEFSFTGK